MEKSKLISLAKKLSKGKLTDSNPSDVYYVMKKEFPYDEIFKALKPIDIITLCFLIPRVKENINLDTLYEEIRFNLFVFRFYEVIEVDPEVECGQCGGSGEVNCSECDGSGTIDCDECEGTGEVEGDDGDETCTVCDGEGTVYCGNCNGGYEACDNCEGTGEFELQGEFTIEDNEFVCYSSKLKDILLTKEEYEIMTDEFAMSIFYNPKVILLSKYSGNSELNNIDFDKGDYFFGEMSEDTRFGKFHGRIGTSTTSLI